MSLPDQETTPARFREMIRKGEFTGPTPGHCPGYAQANLVILPQEHAFHFLLFCQRNPRPCPVLEVLEPGCYEPKVMGPGADIRTDLPRYRVWRKGELVDEPTEVKDLCGPDMVSFLVGCSFSFEEALENAGVGLRHIEEGVNVPMYRTNRACNPAGPFQGPLVVSMRPLAPGLIPRAVEVTERFPAVHGAPLFVGGADDIGIKDISRPDFGDPVTIREGEIPVFWACGVTSSMAALAIKADLVVTHAPGHMFVTDKLNKDIAQG